MLKNKAIWALFEATQTGQMRDIHQRESGYHFRLMYLAYLLASTLPEILSQQRTQFSELPNSRSALWSVKSLHGMHTVQWTSEQPFGALKCWKAAWYAHSSVNFRTAVRRSEVLKGCVVCTQFSELPNSRSALWSVERLHGMQGKRKRQMFNKCFRENRCARRKSNSLYPYVLHFSKFVNKNCCLTHIFTDLFIQEKLQRLTNTNTPVYERLDIDEIK